MYTSSPRPYTGPNNLFVPRRLSGLGIVEPTDWQSLVDTQREIAFTGADGKPAKAAGIFVGIEKSRVSSKKVLQLQPSGLTTNPANPVKIYAKDLTRVYLDNITSFLPSSFDMSKWAFLDTQYGGSGTVPPPTEEQIKLKALAPQDKEPPLKWQLAQLMKNPWLWVVTGLASVGVILAASKRGSSATPTVVPLVKPTIQYRYRTRR
jgi:hypothetical protein